jgi:hypothetical protein
MPARGSSRGSSARAWSARPAATSARSGHGRGEAGLPANRDYFHHFLRVLLVGRRSRFGAASIAAFGAGAPAGRHWSSRGVIPHLRGRTRRPFGVRFGDGPRKPPAGVGQHRPTKVRVDRPRTWMACRCWDSPRKRRFSRAPKQLRRRVVRPFQANHQPVVWFSPL